MCPDDKKILEDFLSTELEDFINQNNAVFYNTNKLLSAKQADKLIFDSNKISYSIELSKDNDSKRGFRKIVLFSLIFLLVLQIFFGNCIVNKVVENALIVNPETNLPVISIDVLSLLVDLMKWYIGATAAELVAIFAFVVNAVFKSPENPNKNN